MSISPTIDVFKSSVKRHPIKSPGIMSEFPRYMMCKFLQPPKINYEGYQSGEYELDEFFEVEILRVEEEGKTIVIQSLDVDVNLDRYKSYHNGYRVCLYWDDDRLQYISDKVSYTVPWCSHILSDNIILLPSMKLSLKYNIKNFMSKKIKEVNAL